MFIRATNVLSIGAQLLILVSILSGCANTGEVLTNPAPDATMDVGKAVKRLGPSSFFLGTTQGSFFDPTEGHDYSAVETLDPRNAMVYIYRPSSEWAEAEVQAPSFFVDGQRVFGLKSGSFVWLEVHGGLYELYAKRPLSLLHLKTIFSVPLDVQGGQVYYLRYSEVEPLDLESHGFNPEDYFSDGPLQEVPEGIALQEISATKADQRGVYLAGLNRTNVNWAPFETFPDDGLESVERRDDFNPDSIRREVWWKRSTSWVFGLFSRDDD